MNQASHYAFGLAAQLQAIADTSTVRSDPSLKTAIDELRQCCIGYGNLVDQVCRGFDSFASGEPVWDPMTYPIMLAGERVLTASAAQVALHLRVLPVPELPQRVPTWQTVRLNVTDTAVGAASGAFSIAKASIGTVAKAGVKSIFQRRNPLSTLVETIGKENVETVLGKVLNPASTLQEAAATLLPRVKKGLDLGVDLGTELGALLGEIVSDNVEYVTADFAAYKQLESSVYEARALVGLAQVLEQSAVRLPELRKAVVSTASAEAIAAELSPGRRTAANTTVALRRALAEVASADASNGKFIERAEEGFKRLFARGGSLFRDALTQETATAPHPAPAPKPVDPEAPSAVPSDHADKPTQSKRSPRKSARKPDSDGNDSSQ